jgi:hypothetical protein
LPGQEGAQADQAMAAAAILIFPWRGLASWRAYRDLVALPAPD